MKPRRTVNSNKVFSLVGGNEDNDLWVERHYDQLGTPMLSSVWVPTEKERTAIAKGANIELSVWGIGHPPVAMGVVETPLMGVADNPHG